MKNKTIHKYALRVADEVVVSIPRHASFLSVQDQGGTLCVWALIDLEEPARPTKFLIFGTGSPIDEDVNTDAYYIGTVQQSAGKLVWHVFVERQ